ncbi:hypothetical protein [Hymenobacter sp. AT01-02]|uniref:Nmad2 family putative nucleotide modification protein n=1 Tax=Hymenobacter sp. AT01-02 TaxID=1571877 RepID=UPI0005F25BC4|nr:hypothetical protein [Hymenobacter sp. AT01-02]
MALYSYVLRYDSGDAPNPYGGICTLAICKPAIRRTAKVGDWIIGTGSKCSRVGNHVEDMAGYLVYAMRVSRKLTLEEYDHYSKQELTIKIPGHKEHRHLSENVAGDSLYDYTRIVNGHPQHRGGLVHQNFDLQIRDWRGLYVLLSNEFYYFGREPRALPDHLQRMVKKGQGHYRRTDPNEIEAFEYWIQSQGFEQNKLYAEPQSPIWQPRTYGISTFLQLS